MSALAGLVVGAAVALALVRCRGVLRRESQETARLMLPWRLQLEVRFDPQPDGLILPEALEVLQKIRRISQLVDFNWLLSYIEKYRLSYIGLKGHNLQSSWNPGCLACSALDWSPRAGYRIYLNPELDLEETAARLSQELGLELKPDEVQTFLFLHEVGHTRQAGNICFISAAINSALSGGRRTHRRRRELNKLKEQVEKYADNFALQELQKWRAARLGAAKPSQELKTLAALSATNCL
jgi:hypothetical protein